MKDEISPRYEGRDQTLSANAARVSSLVEMAADDMALTNGEKVPLSDAQKVRTYGEKYLRECATNAVLPTVRGCAAKLGVTRQALYFYAKQHPNSEFAHWLDPVINGERRPLKSSLAVWTGSRTLMRTS